MDSDTGETEVDTATKQAVNDRDERGRFISGNTPTAGFHTNPERRNDGSWNKADTPRYKLEQMMVLTDKELSEVIDSKKTPAFERKLAQSIVDGSWSVLRDMINEVYGKPKETIDVNSQENSIPIIKGFVIPTLPEDFIDKDIREQMGEEKAKEILDGKR